MQSTPAAKRSSQIFLVMPKPPAAFSPLATTKSIAWSRRSPGRRPSTTSRPDRPTVSPQNNRRILGLRGFQGLRGVGGEGLRILLGHDPIQRLVIVIARHAGDMLCGKGDADGKRFLAGPPQLLQRAVIEA